MQKVLINKQIDKLSFGEIQTYRCCKGNLKKYKVQWVSVGKVSISMGKVRW